MGSDDSSAPDALLERADMEIRPQRDAREVQRKIRVGHLLHTMAYGGPETILLNWIRVLPPDRFESHLICFENPGNTERPFVEAATLAGHKVRYIPWSRRKPLLRSARSMSRIVRELDLDILHCYNTYADIVGVFVKWMTGIKIMTTLWVWGSLGWKRRGLQWAERAALPFFDKVTAQNEDARKGTAGPWVPLESVSVITSGFQAEPVGLSPEERDRGRAALGAGPDDFVLLNLARFWPEKAHDVLLKAFDQIRRRRPETRLWLAGVGPTQEHARQIAVDFGLDPFVSFLGFRRDLPFLLALADMQVHPSHAEGIPLALCSGMAAGVPIVATRVGGVPEIIRHDESGILVTAGQPDTFATAVLELMDDLPKRRRLGQGAKRFILDEYSLERAAAELGTAYAELIR